MKILNCIPIDSGALRSLRFVSLLLLSAACSLPSQPGPQPSDIIPTKFTPGFNIMGVVRVDGTSGSSFIHVERAFRVEEATETFSPVIREATVTIYTHSPDSGFTCTFRSDSLRGDIYTNDTFQPLANREYHLRISGAGLPAVSASTMTPALPVVDTTSLVVSPDMVAFTLLTPPDTAMYDVYLICRNQEYSQRWVHRAGPAKEFKFPLSNDKKPIRIEIYAYDSHLTDYLTSAITIKPQTYRETVTTVAGGYGCFGSVSKSVVSLWEAVP